MALSPGTPLGPYEIVAALGSGGMGEVYKARDARLSRLVALKVLPTAAAMDPERRERFEREARAVAALNHPNIVTIHSVEQADGVTFLTMELVDGRPLSEVIPKHGLPLERLLKIAIAVADAVAAAHQKGITHRDLKPANIMLGEGEQQGRVKVLDFGLAKLTDVDAHAAATSTTRLSPVTGEGRIFGTAAYMSPEQAEGRQIDTRSDVFSLGIVLYEMATGQRPFAGDTNMSILSSIVKDTPRSITDLNAALPSELGRIVRRALHKDVDRRYQTVKDLRNDLEELKAALDSGALLAETAGTGPRGTATRASRSRRPWMWPAIVGIGAAISGAVMMLLPGPKSQPVVRLAITLPEEASADLGASGISPDGSLVVTTLGRDASSYLALRPFDSDEFRRLPGTDGGRTPFWSPDSKHIAFFVGSRLKRFAVAGGAPQTVCDIVDDDRGGAWGTSNTILIGTNYGKGHGLLRVSAEGGRPTPVTRLDEGLGENSHRNPVFLPDGNRFVYFARTTADENRAIYLESLDGQSPRKRLIVADSAVKIGRDPSSGRDYLLYSKDDTLWAQAFDTNRGELQGDPAAISRDVGVFSVSTSGTLVSRRTGAEKGQLTWFDRAGRSLATIGDVAEFEAVQLSPDDKWVAVVVHRGVSGYFVVWLIDPARNLSTPFSLQTERSMSPVWSPDSKRIYFDSFSRGGQLFSKAVGDVAAEQLFAATPRQVIRPRDISSDGRYLLAEVSEGGASRTTLVYAPFGKDDWRPLLRSGFNEEHGQFSPDSKWVAYQSNESGSPEIWVSDFPGGMQKHRISEKGGVEPRWRRDGKELFYLSAQQNLMSVALGTDFLSVQSSVLFRAGPLSPSFGPRYSVTADGQRFLVQIGRPDVSRTLDVILNWPALLPARNE